MYCIDHAIPVSDGTIWTDLPKKGIPAEGKTWRERYVSLTLVFDYRATRRAYLEIRDARASDPHVDNRARCHRIAPRRRRYPPGFSLQERTISSSRPHFFYTGCNPGSLHLLQAEYSSSRALTSHLDGRVTSRAACNDAKLQETPFRTELRSSLIGAKYLVFADGWPVSEFPTTKIGARRSRFLRRGKA